MVSAAGDCACSSPACGEWSAVPSSTATHTPDQRRASCVSTSPTVLRILRIDSLEVLQDRAPLIGGQSAQLFPRRLAELRSRAAAGVRVVGPEVVSGLRRRGFALLRILTLVFLQRTASVEQTPEELLLPRDRGRVETSTLQCFSELLGFLGELRGAIAAGRLAHLVERLGYLSLLSR